MTKFATIAALGLLCALHAGMALAQETAGRVLVVAGNLTIERGAERVAAKVGTEVRAGDTLVVGPLSNAQVLLTDQSIFSLRPDSSLKLSEYAFKDKAPEAQRGFFDLTKGGLRTLSGLIGKAKPDNYRVTTATAVIGIRGTHYSLVICADDCRDASGTLAANGTYGAVTDGRISVTNQTGETVFGANQYFTVASPTSRPQQLVAPPSFLRDSLQGRAKAAPGAVQVTEAQPTATPSGDVSITANAAVPTAPATLNRTVDLIAATTATQGLATVVEPGPTGTVFFRAANVAVPVNSCSTPPCGSVTVLSALLGVNLALQRASASLVFKGGQGDAFNLGTPIVAGTDGIPVTVRNGVLSFSQTYLRSDYPQNNGAFRCQACGVNSTPGYLDFMTFAGTINGGTAQLTVTGSSPTDSGSFPINLAQTALPNTAIGAIVIRNQTGGAISASNQGFGISVDGSGRLLSFGVPGGDLTGSVGSSTNVIAGTATAGNLVWGNWAGGAQLTDFNYMSYAAPGTTRTPWITGTAPDTLPPSLGTLTYVPVGSFINAGTNARLNSASLTADFVGRSLAVNLNATNLSSGNTLQMNGSTGISAITPRFAARFESVTCTGPCTGGAVSGNYAGFFAGPNAEGAGIAFSAGSGVGGGVTGVAAFKR